MGTSSACFALFQTPGGPIKPDKSRTADHRRETIRSRAGRHASPMPGHRGVRCGYWVEGGLGLPSSLRAVRSFSGCRARSRPRRGSGPARHHRPIDSTSRSDFSSLVCPRAAGWLKNGPKSSARSRMIGSSWRSAMATATAAYRRRRFDYWLLWTRREPAKDAPVSARSTGPSIWRSGR